MSNTFVQGGKFCGWRRPPASPWLRPASITDISTIALKITNLGKQILMNFQMILLWRPGINFLIVLFMRCFQSYYIWWL